MLDTSPDKLSQYFRYMETFMMGVTERPLERQPKDDYWYILTQDTIQMFCDDILLSTYFCNTSKVERYFRMIKDYSANRFMGGKMNAIMNIMNRLDDDTFTSIPSRFERIRHG